MLSPARVGQLRLPVAQLEIRRLAVVVSCASGSIAVAAEPPLSGVIAERLGLAVRQLVVQGRSPEAVMLDLVQPAVAGGRLLGGCRKAAR